MPKRPRVGWVFILAATLLVTCLLTLASTGRPGAPRFAILHDRQNVAWLTWIVLAPAIIFVARRFPFGDGAPWRWLAQHMALGAMFSLASVALAAAVERVMRSASHQMVDAPAVPPPWFFTMSVTVIVSPAAAAAGTVMSQNTRSAPSWIGRAVTLLPSSHSGTAWSASARAMTYQEPAVVPAGIVRAVDAVLAAPAASAGTARVPRSVSFALHE